MSRRGWNPCIIEGCPNVGAGPKGTVVCQDCRDKLKRYDEMRARVDQGVRVVAIGNYARVPGSRRPRFSGDERSDPKAWNARGRLEDALERFRAACEPASGRRHAYEPQEGDARSEFYKPPRSAHNEYTRLRMPEHLAQAFADIDALVRYAVEEAEAEGKRQGTNLLAQLAAGELTSADFERKAGITPD